MALFPVGVKSRPTLIGAGEIDLSRKGIYTTSNFKAGEVIIGSFIALGANGDYTSTIGDNPIAGVALRMVSSAIQSGTSIDPDVNPQLEYVRWGHEVTVAVKAGATPTRFGKVYVDATTGEATATDTDKAFSAEFVEKIDDSTWWIRLI